MELDPQLVVRLLRALWHLARDEHGDFWLCMTIIWRLYRRIRYGQELLRRQLEQSLRSQNETVKSLIESFSVAPPPRLRDLANDTDSDFRLR